MPQCLLSPSSAPVCAVLGNACCGIDFLIPAAICLSLPITQTPAEKGSAHCACAVAGKPSMGNRASGVSACQVQAIAGACVLPPRRAIGYNRPRQATLAQSAEQALRKRQVMGSSPMGGSSPRHSKIRGAFLSFRRRGHV